MNVMIDFIYVGFVALPGTRSKRFEIYKLKNTGAKWDPNPQPFGPTADAYGQPF